MCINGHHVPKEWKTAFVTPLYNKGDRNNCDTNRALSVTSTFSWLYGSIIKGRI